MKGTGQGEGKEGLVTSKRLQSLEQQVGEQGAVHGQGEPQSGELAADDHQDGLGELDQVPRFFMSTAAHTKSCRWLSFALSQNNKRY